MPRIAMTEELQDQLLAGELDGAIGLAPDPPSVARPTRTCTTSRSRSGCTCEHPLATRARAIVDGPRRRAGRRSSARPARPAVGLQRRACARCSPRRGVTPGSWPPPSCSPPAPGRAHDYLGVSGEHRLPADGRRACRSSRRRTLPFEFVQRAGADPGRGARVRARSPRTHLAAVMRASACRARDRHWIRGPAPPYGRPCPTPSSSSTAPGWPPTAGSTSRRSSPSAATRRSAPEWPRKTGDVDALRARHGRARRPRRRRRSSTTTTRSSRAAGAADHHRALVRRADHADPARTAASAAARSRSTRPRPRGSSACRCRRCGRPRPRSRTRAKPPRRGRRSTSSSSTTRSPTPGEPEDARAAFERYAVPEHGPILFQDGLANFTPHAPTEVDFDARGPRPAADHRRRARPHRPARGGARRTSSKYRDVDAVDRVRRVSRTARTCSWPGRAGRRSPQYIADVAGPRPARPPSAGG